MISYTKGDCWRCHGSRSQGHGPCPACCCPHCEEPVGTTPPPHYLHCAATKNGTIWPPEPAPSPRFKLGDRVRWPASGMLGTVTNPELHNTGWGPRITVEWDDGHTLLPLVAELERAGGDPAEPLTNHDCPPMPSEPASAPFEVWPQLQEGMQVTLRNSADWFGTLERRDTRWGWVRWERWSLDIRCVNAEPWSLVSLEPATPTGISPATLAALLPELAARGLIADARWPHRCLRCGAPAYAGLVTAECSRGAECGVEREPEIVVNPTFQATTGVGPCLFEPAFRARGVVAGVECVAATKEAAIEAVRRRLRGDQR